MKKIIFSTIALAGALVANAEYLEVHHTTTSNFRAELEAAFRTIDNTASDEKAYKEVAAKVTELKIISDLDKDGNPVPLHIYGVEDCAALRVYFRPSNNAASQIKKIDFSEAVFQDNATGTPGSQGDFLSYLSTLEEVVLPESVVSLCGAFYDCSNLIKVNLENITTFGKGALAGCPKLVITELPANLKKIYANAFEHESHAKPKFQFPAGYELPETLESIGDATFKGWNVAWTKLPPHVEEIGAEAFMETKCTFSELPSSLKTIGKAAFRKAPVTFSYLPESVQSVGYDAFIMCPTITDFTLSGIFETEVPDRVFYLSEPVDRSFTCRAQYPPVVALAGEGTSQGSNKAVTGSFGPDKSYAKHTFYCLYDYKDNYNKLPWNKNLKYLSTAVAIDASANVKIEHQHHGKITGSQDIYEGAHEWTITPDAGYFITSIRYEESAPAKIANIRTDDDESFDEPGEGDDIAEEPATDPAQLYAVDPEMDNDALKALAGQAQKVTVPVTANPGSLKIETQKWIQTGVDAITAAPAISRCGNIITVSEGTATLYDLTGKAIITSAEIDLNNLTPGVYIVRAGSSAMKIAL